MSVQALIGQLIQSSYWSNHSITTTSAASIHFSHFKLPFFSQISSGRDDGESSSSLQRSSYLQILHFFSTIKRYFLSSSSFLSRFLTFQALLSLFSVSPKENISIWKGSQSSKKPLSVVRVVNLLQIFLGLTFLNMIITGIIALKTILLGSSLELNLLRPQWDGAIQMPKKKKNKVITRLLYQWTTFLELVWLFYCNLSWAKYFFHIFLCHRKENSNHSSTLSNVFYIPDEGEEHFYLCINLLTSQD